MPICRGIDRRNSEGDDALQPGPNEEKGTIERTCGRMLKHAELIFFSFDFIHVERMCKSPA